MSVKIAINGFGRIGRLFFRIAFDDPAWELVAINARANSETLAHLLKYDSTHGRYQKEVVAGEDYLQIDGKKVKVIREENPANLPWKALGVDLVVESTGKFNSAEKAMAHIEAGAKKVVLTAPGKNEDVTLVYGVNEKDYDPQNHRIISNASCTTNCLAPLAKVIDAEFGIEKGLMTTIHSYTNDQQVLDKTHKDLRRARAAACSIIPTTTGAARAVAKVLPQLKGKLNGFALRVPTPNVSVVDLTVELKKEASAEEINQALQKAEANELQGILGVSLEPLVSVDYNGDSRSTIVDALSTMVVGGNLAKIIAWYDNEWGYTCRVADLVRYIIKQGL